MNNTNLTLPKLTEMKMIKNKLAQKDRRFFHLYLITMFYQLSLIGLNLGDLKRSDGMVNLKKIKYFRQCSISLPGSWLLGCSLCDNSLICTLYIFQNVFYFTIYKVLKPNRHECFIFRRGLVAQKLS